MTSSFTMVQSWILICSCALVLVCTAQDGPDMEQREVTFDLSDIHGLKGIIQPDSDFTQKEAEVDEAWEIIAHPDTEPGDQDLTQRDISLDLLKDIQLGKERLRSGHPSHTLQVERRGPPMFGPRSFRVPEVPFPPAQPSLENLEAICVQGSGRPRYPPGSLPHTGFSHLTRYGDTINNVESWYSLCCQGNGSQVVKLCCARQAWEEALSKFCEVEFSIKTAHYHCCKLKEEARWNCFRANAPNPSYLATNITPQPQWEQSQSAPGFTWNPDSCQKSKVKPRSSNGKVTERPEDVDINFPPERPTSFNIDLVCYLRKLRPTYSTKCLPRSGYGWLRRQSKAINRLEKGVKQCCKGKGDVIGCADTKWREVMDLFCKEEQRVKAPQFSCCKLGDGEQRYACFTANAPYDSKQLTPSGSPKPAVLGQLCDTHNRIRKRFPVSLPVDSFVSQCCSLPVTHRTVCVQAEVDSLSESVCAVQKSVSEVEPCCFSASSTPSECFSKLLLDAITKASQSPRLRKKKCPLPDYQ